MKALKYRMRQERVAAIADLCLAFNHYILSTLYYWRCIILTLLALVPQESLKNKNLTQKLLGIEFSTT
jgi:hypothetical protein